MRLWPQIGIHSLSRLPTIIKSRLQLIFRNLFWSWLSFIIVFNIWLLLLFDIYFSFCNSSCSCCTWSTGSYTDFRRRFLAKTLGSQASCSGSCSLFWLFPNKYRPCTTLSSGRYSSMIGPKHTLGSYHIFVGLLKLFNTLLHGMCRSIVLTIALIDSFRLFGTSSTISRNGTFFCAIYWVFCWWVTDFKLFIYQFFILFFNNIGRLFKF